MINVSILMPVYNAENTVMRALNSIPDRDDIEIIIANDGSTDNTLNVLTTYNRNINLINYDQNYGVGVIRGELINHASGK